MKNLFAIVFVGLLAVSCAQTTKKTTTDGKDAKAKAGATAKTVTSGAIECKSGTDVRSLEVKSTAGGHEVVYTKFGEAKSIATGGKEHCEAIKERVKGNLEKSGYTCK